MKNNMTKPLPFFIIVLIALSPISLSESINVLDGESENILTLNSFNVSIDKPKGFLYVFNIPLVALPHMIPFKGIIIGTVT